ncbi:hypothetical protein QTP70_016187 [Hemibagrus guttatus]|uniref:TNFR-Cys domain-containing protein n=1 Tax=Hemibagrus guttatus TaxID=175788 RepID=A0AAE0UV93_9TELE|nr:hypothetical protein QTP70_016187 [Hemibagrus guttatus]KAK3547375.1 hypothetical protein QTP86_018873 [Hemibagrus guttatus]
MHLQSVFILLVLSVIVTESCDTETHYMEDNKCCKLCEPGKRMKIKNCDEPMCEECEEGEYQESYNRDSQCKRQPFCDPSTQMSDRVCEVCPIGEFSDQESAITCQPWTVCSLGFIEVAPGSSTSDRICAVNKKLTIITPVIVIMLVMAVAVGLCLFYKKGRTGSISFVRKLQAYSVWGTKPIYTAPEDNVHIENGQEQQPRNQPQEDTEDLLKLETSLVPGISENGLPVIQDHSKSFLLSESETEPESISVHL